MFTIEQIKTAHAKVKTGADFPRYVQEIKKLGVNRYETFVADGHTIYFGRDKFFISSEAKYPLCILLKRVTNKVSKKNLENISRGKQIF